MRDDERPTLTKKENWEMNDKLQLPLDDIIKLAINTKFIDVNILVSKSDNLELYLRGNEEDRQSLVYSYVVLEDKIIVSTSANNRLNKVKLDIFLPSDSDLEQVKIKSTAADVTIWECNVSDILNITTTNANVYIKFNA